MCWESRSLRSRHSSNVDVRLLACREIGPFRALCRAWTCECFEAPSLVLAVALSALSIRYCSFLVIEIAELCSMLSRRTHRQHTAVVKPQVSHAITVYVRNRSVHLSRCKGKVSNQSRFLSGLPARLFLGKKIIAPGDRGHAYVFCMYA